MYLASERWSEGPRQGDIVAGTVILPPACRVNDVKRLAQSLRADKAFKLPLELVIRSSQFLVLSQCCDLGDARVLVCSIAPMRGKVRLDALTAEQRESFLSNEVPERQGAEVVLPGLFYLRSAQGILDGDHIAEFNAVRVFKKAEFAALDKVAELTLGARQQLRLKLATFFGRVPREDLERSPDNPDEGAPPDDHDTSTDAPQAESPQPEPETALEEVEASAELEVNPSTPQDADEDVDAGKDGGG